jgi:filamentous hemagglutinin family protein
MLRFSWIGHSPRLRPTALPALKPICTALSLALPGIVHASGPLPQGGQFVAGTGSMNGNATSLTIHQTSNRGVIDWTSFSIGNGDHVSIINGTGATLNRVTGANPASILGTLSATGSVYLIDPQGIVIGSSGIVSTGGRFVASTLNANNTAFMNGAPLTLSGTSTHSVVNLGKIASSGGDVFLIARNNVENLGTISAPNGTAELAAGQTVLLHDSSSNKQVFVQQGSGGTVLNRGTIEAAQINLQAADGNVYALAGTHAVLRATGTASRQGHVWLVANTGNVELNGSVTAINANGGGGTVDTNAAHVAIGTDPSNATTVNANQWNLTTPSFTIGGLAAPVFQRSLDDGTSINLQTTGAGGASGNIDVASSIQWFGPASLTLGAYHSLTIEAAAKLTNTGSGNLTLNADSKAIDNGGSVTNNGTVDWSASNGIVSAYYDMNGSYSPGTLLANASWTSPADSGLVTQITAYKLVNSFADLLNINADLNANYALGRDIDASATNNVPYVPIGAGGTAFNGQFDGRGHSITSLNMIADSSNGPVTLGLFGTVGSTLGSSAVVRNLNVSGYASIGTALWPWTLGVQGWEGMLAGINYGTIVRVHTSGTIEAGAGWRDVSIVGGLVGLNYGEIDRSSSSVNAKTGGTLGGLVGENDDNGVISQSYASGTVSGYEFATPHGSSDASLGGLVGTNNGSISQSYSTAAVTNSCFYFACSAAGLVDTNNGTISQSYASGPVTGAASIGSDGRADVPANYGVATTNTIGTIGNDVYWNAQSTNTTVGVGSGTPLPASNGLTNAQMLDPANFVGWDFSLTGPWALPAGANSPILRWQL